MFPVDYAYLFLLTVYTGGVTLVGTLALRSSQERIFLSCGAASIYFYSGVGAALPDVPTVYALYYGVFVAVFVIAFVIGARVVKHDLVFCGIQRYVTQRSSVFRNLAIAYLVLCLIPLMYPEFRLQLLVNPPLPDIRTLFYARVAGQTGSGLLAFHTQLKTLLLPLFLIGVSRFKHQNIAIPMGIAMFLYIEYCSDAYIGRYEILQYTFVAFFTLYLLKTVRTRSILILGGTFMIGFIVFYGFYTQVRLGVSVVKALGPGISFVESFANLAASEFSYPRFFSIMLEAGRQVDLWHYVTWIVTLPFPKALIGSEVSLRLNNDISEYLFGISVGEGGAYVVLVSVVGESVFIFGPYFFWIHAMLLGLVFGVLCGLFRGTPVLESSFAYLASLLLLLGRGGVSSVLPPVVNTFLLVYLWMFLSKRERRETYPVVP